MKEKVKQLRELVKEYLDTTNLYNHSHVFRKGEMVIVTLFKYKVLDDNQVCMDNKIMSQPESQVDKLIKFFKDRV
jgi:hypothetical protein